MSAREIFLAFGDYLWDFFCSPASGYVIGIAGILFIIVAVYDFACRDFVWTFIKDSRKKAERVKPDNSKKWGDNRE